MTLDIAVWLLFSRRRNIKASETVQTRYQEAIKFLKDVASGAAQLDQPVGATPQNSTGGPVVASKSDIPSDPNSRFSDSNLKGYS
jgi:phage gp36-like protein